MKNQGSYLFVYLSYFFNFCLLCCLQSRKEEAQALKESGNNLFKEGEYAEAIKAYGKGLQLCPPSFAKDRSIMYSNRAACHMRSVSYVLLF